MSVVGLHHAGILVASLERSIEFYQDVFGLAPAEQFSVGDEKIVFLFSGSSRLELIQASGGRRQTGVVDHVALEVDNLDALTARLRERGVNLLDAAPVPVPALHARILFCLGPDAERIELIEYARPG